MSSSRKLKKRNQKYQKQQYHKWEEFWATVVAEKKLITFLYNVIGEIDKTYFEWYLSIVQFLMNFGIWDDETGFTINCTKEEFETQFNRSFANMKNVFDIKDDSIDSVMFGIRDRFSSEVIFRVEGEINE